MSGAEAGQAGTGERISECQKCGKEFVHEHGYKERIYCSKQCHLNSIRTQSGDEDTAEAREHGEVYEALEGHGTQSSTTQILVEAGYETEEDLRQADPQNLLNIRGIAGGTVSQLCRNLDNPWETPLKYGPG